jgi:RNA polymerase sigma-70 factor (ECF subfamily)
MLDNDLIPHLYRTQFSKMVAVLCKLFGAQYISVAEDLVSDTFLLAAETWGQTGMPANPVAWLHTVAKNKACDFVRRQQLFDQKIGPEIKYGAQESFEVDIDLSDKNISDSQLQMMFAICQPSIPAEAQIGLSLRILCGFGIDEIADAFLTNKETINKRLFRAKEKLKEAGIKIELPSNTEIPQRLQAVLTTLYLLFNEGYYSKAKNTILRKDLCLEAMRLTLLLLDNEATNLPEVNALLSLMCFHASRFEARTNPDGELVLYPDQDPGLWNQDLIERGRYYLHLASKGSLVGKYHLEAAIAYQHTDAIDQPQKWENVLLLYNRLLKIEYSPMAALNRAYALAKAKGAAAGVAAAEELGMEGNHLYHSLLGDLYANIDHDKALKHLRTALSIARTDADKRWLQKRIAVLVG